MDNFGLYDGSALVKEDSVLLKYGEIGSPASSEGDLDG